MPLRPNTKKGLCHLCNEPSTKVMEINVYEKPPAGSGRNRGGYVKGSTKRMCDRHASQFIRLMTTERRNGSPDAGLRRRDDDQRTL